MVFLDSNLFLIDRFFPRDAAYAANRRFLARLAELDAVLPLLTLLEVCGAASFRLSAAETDRWLHDFGAVYRVRILDPFGAGTEGAGTWLANWAEDVAGYLARQMTFGDAVLAREADRWGADALVTWNVRDFQGKTATRVVSPDRFFP